MKPVPRRREHEKPRRAREKQTSPATKTAARRANAPAAVPPLPLLHPATLLVALIAAAGVVLSVSFRIMDTDFWQHLLVGKAIWAQHRVPLEHQWTWPNYGTSEVSWVGRSGWSPSWGFRALIWPVWDAGGVTGLFAWRWVTTLAAFGIAWAAARKMGARGLVPLVVIVWCSLFYRHRSQIRPETLTAVLLALELWLLSSRRFGGQDSSGRAHVWWLVAVAWAWANCHITYFLFFVILGIHLIEEAWRTRALPRTLAAVGAASLAACFVNPFGWQALWAPFDYFLHLRDDPMFKGIGELQPLSWANNQTDGVFAMLPLWPLLILWRWRRIGFDAVAAMICLFFTWYMVQSERFFGAYAVSAAVFVSRDLDALVRTVRRPRWATAPFARAALAAAAIVAVGAAEWARADRPLSISIDMRRFPVGAMDFIERHGVAGHGFSQQRVAGYQLWRFWPDRERLPFMDIHATATPEDRAAYALALSRRAGWRTLDRDGRFDYVVLDPWGADSLLAALDADPSMALVFLDDTGVLYVRRGGRNGAVADSFDYRFVGGGAEKSLRTFAAVAAATAAGAAGATGDLAPGGGGAGSDAAGPAAASGRAGTTMPPVSAEASALRAALLAELDRLAASSPRNARANSMAATLAIAERRFPDASAALLAALKADPKAPLVHFRLASLALFDNRPTDAIAEYERERKLGERPGLDLGIGMAHRLASNNAEAKNYYKREAERWPGTPTGRAAENAMGELR
ncbi:MAG: hypothetical protein ABIS67_13920 [Candidatus Eisenbacteria bacterium]